MPKRGARRADRDGRQDRRRPGDGVVAELRPERAVGKGSDAYFAKLFAKANKDRAPLLNRATDGIYPPGSTFKPVTAIAPIESRPVDVSDEILCGKDLIVDGQKYQQLRDRHEHVHLAAHGALAVVRHVLLRARQAALRRAPRRTATASRRPLWMRRLGFGAPTGLDIPRRRPAWRPTPSTRSELFGKDPINNKWTSGDAVNASIGQGFVQVTPLQMATLYALIANGGTLVTPHLADTIEDPGGDVVKQLRFKAAAQGRHRPVRARDRSAAACAASRTTSAAPPRTRSPASRSASPARPAPRRSRRSTTSPGSPATRRSRIRSWSPSP